MIDLSLITSEDKYLSRKTHYIKTHIISKYNSYELYGLEILYKAANDLLFDDFLVMTYQHVLIDHINFFALKIQKDHCIYLKQNLGFLIDIVDIKIVIIP